MNISTLFDSFYIMPVIMGLVSLCILLLGARGVVTKKPFVVSSRVFFFLMVLNFLPMLLSFAGSRFDEYYEFSWLDVVIPAVYIVLLVFFWIQMQGFSIFGIAEDPLRRSLHAALNQLGIPFEERLSKIRLLDTNADLQINVQGRMGVAAINIKPKSEGATLERIMTVLREDFASSSGIANLTTGYFQIALGLLLLAMSVGLFSLQQSSNARMKEYERQSEVYNSTYTRTP